MNEERKSGTWASWQGVVVISTRGNIVWKSDRQGRVSIKGHMIMVKNSTGNLLEAYQLRPGEQVIVTE